MRSLFWVQVLSCLLAISQLPLHAQSVAHLTVVSAASLKPEVSPGSLVFVMGEGLATEMASIHQSETAAPPTTLAGIQVLFDNIPARITYVTPEMIYCQVPTELSAGEVPVTVTSDFGGQRVPIAKGTATIVAIAPGIFSEDNTGKGSGRIYEAKQGLRAPFRIHTSGPAGIERTRVMLTVTGIREAILKGGDPGSSISVIFLRRDAAQEFTVRPVLAELALEYAGVEHVFADLPLGLQGADVAFVGIQVEGKMSNFVSFTLMPDDPPANISFQPRQIKPGQVLEVSGQNLAFSTDGRDRVLLVAENGLSALAIPFEVGTSSVVPGSPSMVLRIIVPPLTESLRKDWFEGPVRVCVETEGIRGCSNELLQVVRPEPLSTPPGHVLISQLEAIYDAFARQAGSDQDQVAKILAVKQQARSFIQAKIDAALAGTPDRTRIALPDGTVAEVVHDLEAIQKLEQLLSASAQAIDLTPHEISREDVRSAFDSRIEDRLRRAAQQRNNAVAHAALIARTQLIVGAGALLACLSTGTLCLPVAEAMTHASPFFAYLTLLHIALILDVDLAPNTLQELHVTPSSLQFRPWDNTQLQVTGKFVPVVDVRVGLKPLAVKVITQVFSTMIGNLFGAGMSTGLLIEKFLGPVVNIVADALLNAGLSSMVNPSAPVGREVLLSPKLVNSSCLRGSSPARDAAYFLDYASWTLTAYRATNTTQVCHFQPRAGEILTLPTADIPVSITFSVTGPTDCYVLPPAAPSPIFSRIAQVTAPNSNGDRLVLGVVADSKAFNFLMGDFPSGLPLASYPNEMVCGTWVIAPGCAVEAYLPSLREKSGDYGDWREPLRDPMVPGGFFPGNIIPRFRMGPGGPFGLRVRSVNGCQP